METLGQLFYSDTWSHWSGVKVVNEEDGVVVVVVVDVDLEEENGLQAIMDHQLLVASNTHLPQRTPHDKVASGSKQFLPGKRQFTTGLSMAVI